MTSALEHRLRRIERDLAARDAPPIRPAILELSPDEDAEPHIAAFLAATGQRRDRTPVLICRGHWDLAREDRFWRADP